MPPRSCRRSGLAALILMLGLGVPALAQEGPGDLLRIVNATRAKAGCAALTADPRLMAAAEVHAKAMATKNFFSHTGKDGSKPATRVRRQGYSFRSLAENIAGGQPTAAGVLESWLQSPPHRRNIRNCAFTDAGVAMVYQANDTPVAGQTQPLRYYWVLLFGAP